MLSPVTPHHVAEQYACHIAARKRRRKSRAHRSQRGQSKVPIDQRIIARNIDEVRRNHRKRHHPHPMRPLQEHSHCHKAHLRGQAAGHGIQEWNRLPHNHRSNPHRRQQLAAGGHQQRAHNSQRHRQLHARPQRAKTLLHPSRAKVLRNHRVGAQQQSFADNRKHHKQRRPQAHRRQCRRSHPPDHGNVHKLHGHPPHLAHHNRHRQAQQRRHFATDFIQPNHPCFRSTNTAKVECKTLSEKCRVPHLRRAAFCADKVGSN